MRELTKLYRNEQRFFQLFIIFTVLAIFIASLGIFGLSAFTAELRTKEIGVRKVFGASVGNIVLMLSKEIYLPGISWLSGRHTSSLLPNEKMAPRLHLSNRDGHFAIYPGRRLSTCVSLVDGQLSICQGGTGESGEGVEV